MNYFFTFLTSVLLNFCLFVIGLQDSLHINDLTSHLSDRIQILPQCVIYFLFCLCCFSDVQLFYAFKTSNLFIYDFCLDKPCLFQDYIQFYL